MASSGSFIGARVGTSPNLILEWQTLQQDVANNRSQVRLTLKLYSEFYVNFSATKTGVLDGTSFSYAGGMTGSNITKTLYTKDTWVNHNSDGSLTINFSASFNINISWGGSNLPTLYVSGNANLDTIPRASSLNSFSFGADMAKDTANSISLSITRASDGFTHDITLSLAGVTISTWTDQGLPTSLALTVAQINQMLNLLPNSSTGTATLSVQTKSGATNIGSPASRTATATVSTSVAPTASGLTVEISGSGRDKTISKFVQSISKAVSSFTASAGYGASVASTSIVIRRDSDDADAHTISGTSGTTGILSLSGTYEAIATVTDSRGRTATQRITFTVYAYSTPTISTFTAVRYTVDETVVQVTRAGGYTPLSAGDNTLALLIQKRPVGGSWTTVQSINITTATFTGTIDSAGILVTGSYEFLITLTDSFGKIATSMVTVSTSKVILAIKKNEAVGIGKIPETGQGILQVLGDSKFDGAANFTGALTKGGNTVWHAGNDGSGSTLDADLLDGLHASGFYKQSPTVYTPSTQVALDNLINNISAFPDNSSFQYVIGLSVALASPFTGGVFFVQGFKTNNNYCIMTAQRYVDTGIATWTRSAIAGVWKSWVEIPTFGISTWIEQIQGNANGVYIKFRDGMLLMGYGVGKQLNASGIADFTITYPVTMTTKYMIGSFLNDSGAGSWAGRSYLASVTTTNCRCVVYGGNPNVWHVIEWWAFGRWY